MKFIDREEPKKAPDLHIHKTGAKNTGIHPPVELSYNGFWPCRDRFRLCYLKFPGGAQNDRG